MIDEQVQELRKQWERSDSPPPNIFAFLERAADDPSQKVALILQDQHYRWQTEQPLRVEDYLSAFVSSRADDLLQLAIGEFRARRSRQTITSIEEFTDRFAGIRESLRGQLMELMAEDLTAACSDLESTHSVEDESDVAAQQFGRYVATKVLGQGAYGIVYLGVDKDLQRHVAIKVPRSERFQKPEDADEYLAEARIAATLDDPNIVPVYDVGRTSSGAVYVVSKFIEGRTLLHWVRADRMEHGDLARLLAKVARALHHAHRKRLIHRDIKPANILIEERTGNPYITDFGLAIKEEEFLLLGRSLAGTPAYMSPEQARGEGHRLDGRSDIFSLGVVMYELLTRVKPFRGRTSQEILHQVVSVEPTPPRELDPEIPIQLQRICLKALSKKPSDRYADAEAFAEDLQKWQPDPQFQKRDVAIVPQGLRSFDAEDAEYFIDMLPGARDREGMPEVIRFWKTRIEQTDSDRTFPVGLICGPSGCGKSSLVKAGLLPRLSASIRAIYIEADPNETESRIQRALHKIVPDIDDRRNLVEQFANLRRTAQHKVVVIIDQFEQWLQAHRADQDSELVRALRHCDGGSLQAILMVREDFAMAAARLMDSLDIAIMQGHNFATVELFDVEHAQDVLGMFGRAYGRLPVQRSERSEDQTKFVEAAARGLARDGRVAPVHLALFAEMVKNKPWGLRTLAEVGGTEGVGESFLEETFSARSANPRHRWHLDAARGVLRALLPGQGTVIRGHMRSTEELLEASGYQNRPKEFRDLLRILDGELRLITPTDPQGFEHDTGSNPNASYYQLTHDYLVPSLRDWLSRKQRETLRGRAELRLAELDETWAATSRPSHLPGVIDWLRIWAFSKRSLWTPTQRRMMSAANWRHGIRLVVAVSLVLFAVLFQSYVERGSRANSLVRQLSSAEISNVPQILQEIRRHQQHCHPLLYELLNHSDDARGKLHASLALADVDSERLEFVLEKMYDTDPFTLSVIADCIYGHREQLTKRLWERFADGEASRLHRLRAAQVLVKFDPPLDEASLSEWRGHASSIWNELIVQSLQNPRDYPALVAAFSPIRKLLYRPLAETFRDADSRKRSVATSLLIDFAADDPRILATFLPDADVEQFEQLYPHLTTDRKLVIAELARFLEQLDAAHGESAGESSNNGTSVDFERRQAIAATALLRLGAGDKVWDRFQHAADPTSRSLLIHSVAVYGVRPEMLISHLRTQRDPSSVRGLLQALGTYAPSTLGDKVRRGVLQLGEQFASDKDAGVRASAEWLLRQHGKSLAKKSGDDSKAADMVDNGGWYDGQNDHRLVVLDARNTPTLERRFAISDREVTIRQFKKFSPDYQPHVPSSPSDDCPANVVSWYAAANYCNWLTLQENLGEEAQCYYLDSTGLPIAHSDCESRAGYRLPSGTEWAFACRAGATTEHCFGRAPELLRFYGWGVESSDARLWPGGSLKPNDFGLFDMHGNAMEWCNDITGTNVRALRGGSSKMSFDSHAAGSVQGYLADTAFYSIGFRVVRTIP